MIFDMTNGFCQHILFLYFNQYHTIPTVSARNHPIGTAHQIPVTPIAGIADSTYASMTLVPSEMIVSTNETAGLLIARYNPYSRNNTPIPQ